MMYGKPNGDLIVSDVKATSKKCLTGKTPGKRIAQNLQTAARNVSVAFRKNGFSVTNEAYLVYFNG